MAENERVYNIPLRDVKNISRSRRANYAVKIIRSFVSRHMKVPEENVWIDNRVNEEIWKRGIEKPPSKITVKVIKFEEEESAEVLMAD